MQNYLVSICVPTYNRPNTLEKTLNSLISQTYTNLEIIISDNCSPNPEVSIVLNKFKADKRIKFFRQETNIGPVPNFNFVSEKVTGDFFMKIGDDDWIDKDYITSCVQFLLENPDYAAAYGRAKIFTKAGTFYDDKPMDMNGEDAGERVREYLRKIRHNSPYYGVIRRKYLSYTITKNIIGFDWIIISKIAYMNKIKMLSTPNFYIGDGGDGSSMDTLTKVYGMPYLVRKFPFFSISLNIFFEILFNYQIYKLRFTERVKLAYGCYRIIYKRFSVTSEFKLAGIKFLESLGLYKRNFSNKK